MVPMRGTKYLITKYEEMVLIFPAIAKRYIQNFSVNNTELALPLTTSSKHSGEMIKRGKQE